MCTLEFIFFFFLGQNLALYQWAVPEMNGTPKEDMPFFLLKNLGIPRLQVAPEKLEKQKWAKKNWEYPFDSYEDK